MAKLYYQEFIRQMKADPTKRLRIAVIYSYGANEAEADGIPDEENQAFSRTNRILNSVKTFGNIVCFMDFYYGYIGQDEKTHPGYVDMVNEMS